MNGSSWLTTTQAAQQLGVSRHTVLRMIYAGELQSYKRGRWHRIPAGELERLARAPT